MRKTTLEEKNERESGKRERESGNLWKVDAMSRPPGETATAGSVQKPITIFQLKRPSKRHHPYRRREKASRHT